MKAELTVEGDPKVFFVQKIQELIPNDGTNVLHNLNDLSFLHYEAERQVHENFLKEYQMMVNFVILCIQNSRMKADEKTIGFLHFLATKQDIFHALGLDFVIPSSGPLTQRMELVTNQIDQLVPADKKIFEQLKLLYEQEQIGL